MPDATVELDALTHRYGERVALDAVSMHIPAGQFVGLLGPNGSGKSTLFRILATLLVPTGGKAQVAGYDPVRQPQAVRQHLGVVFQQPALDGLLTVYENLHVHAALYGLARLGRTDRIRRLLEAFGLADRGKDRVQTLSGGLQRRVDLARALLHHPAVLLLDEPTTGLDPVARRQFYAALRHLQQQEGTTVLMATHLLDEAEACEGVGLLDQGRLVAQGTPHALCAAMGEQTLWIETDTPHALEQALTHYLQWTVQVRGDRLQVTHPQVQTLLPILYQTFGSKIRSATVRTPTLEDVFLLHSGYPLSAESRFLTSTPSSTPDPGGLPATEQP
jgi:ABC-2 type transport system ATP-binding protein